MDTPNKDNITLTQRERAKIQRLEWLLKECIGIEEYELCTQIRNVIQRKHKSLDTNQTPKRNERDCSNH
jgi:hypothetical protein